MIGLPYFSSSQTTCRNNLSNPPLEAVNVIVLTTFLKIQIGCIFFAIYRIPYRIQSYLRGPRFISVEEYEKQGILETAKALKELREYCQSPECNTWKTVSRLKSPKRYSMS